MWAAFDFKADRVCGTYSRRHKDEIVEISITNGYTRRRARVKLYSVLSSLKGIVLFTEIEPAASFFRYLWDQFLSFPQRKYLIQLPKEKHLLHIFSDVRRHLTAEEKTESYSDRISSSKVLKLTEV